MIIDCHTHIFPDEIRDHREAFCEKDEGFSSIYRNPKARVSGAEDLVASMDISGVDRSVICGFPWERKELCGLHNEYLLESASRYPDRLIPFISLPFADPDWSGKELEKRVEEGARGVGETAFYRHEMRLQDIELMKPVLKRMEALEIPFLLHMNETIGHPYPGKGITPLERFHELIVLFPNLSFWLAHWGGGLLFYELMPEVGKTMAHVYYDTAASPFLYSKKIYSIAGQIIGPEKILFGTDFPLLSFRRYLKELEESGLSKEDREKILGLNVSRLLGLG